MGDLADDRLRDAGVSPWVLPCSEAQHGDEDERQDHRADAIDGFFPELTGGFRTVAPS